MQAGGPSPSDCAADPSAGNLDSCESEAMPTEDTVANVKLLLLFHKNITATPERLISDALKDPTFEAALLAKGVDTAGPVLWVVDKFPVYDATAHSDPFPSPVIHGKRVGAAAGVGRGGFGSTTGIFWIKTGELTLLH